MKRNFAKAIPDLLLRAANTVISVVAALLAAALVTYSGVAIYDSVYVSESAKGAWDVLEYRPEIVEDADAALTGSALAAINSDYRAWLTIYGTNIDYPVMQADDLYYASHDVFKASSLSGAIYLAGGSAPDFSDNYSILYGHHMDNGAMFGDLDKYADMSYLKEHSKGILVADAAAYELEIFAAFNTDAYESMVYTLGTRSLPDVLTYAQAHAAQYDASVAVGDKLLAMSTCAAETTNGRLVVLAAMTPMDVSAAAAAEPAQPTEPAEPAETAALETPAITGQTGKPWYETLLSPLEPMASENNGKNWSPVNVTSAAMTVYLLIPVGNVKAKYYALAGLSGLAKKTDGKDDSRRLRRSGRIGLAAEAAIAAAAVGLVAATTDLRTPMVAVNRYTPLTLALFAASWFFDAHLVHGGGAGE